jgi:Na+-driven multidrug efflux pump
MGVAGAACNVANAVSQLAMVIFLGTGSAAAVTLGKKTGEGERETAFRNAKRLSLMAPVLVQASAVLPVSALAP